MENMFPVYNLPWKIQKRIIKFLDIESRMALNIYSKMVIPKNIIDNINNIKLPEIKVYLENDNNKHIEITKNLIKNQYDNTKYKIETEIIYFNKIKSDYYCEFRVYYKDKNKFSYQMIYDKYELLPLEEIDVNSIQTTILNSNGP